MSRSTKPQPHEDIASDASVPALIQLLLFLFGAGVGAAGSGWSRPCLYVLGIGLCIPVALLWAEHFVRRRALNAAPGKSVGLGKSAALSEPARTTLAGFFALAAGSYIAVAPEYLCVAVFFASVLGIAAENLIAAATVSFHQLHAWWTRRGWTRVEVVALGGDVATLRSSSGDIVLARMYGGAPLGIAYVDLDLAPASYRLDALAHVEGYESQNSRDNRGGTIKLAGLKFVSAFMWMAVAASPFIDEGLRLLG